jgi:hypothetical protein
MMTLIYANIIPIAASLLIGIATARWTFRRPSSGPDRT